MNYCWVKVPTYERSTSLARLKNMLKFMFMLNKFPLEKFEKPDAIIVSSPSLFPIVRAKKWAMKFKAKLIFEVRDIWPLTLQNLAGISNLHPLIVFMKWFEKFAYKNCDKIVSVLPGAHLHVKTYGIHEEKITCIPNGIDLEEVAHPEQLDNTINEKFLLVNSLLVMLEVLVCRMLWIVSLKLRLNSRKTRKLFCHLW